MFYTGIDPFTMEEVYVPTTAQEKAEQRALLQYFRPENKKIVLSALKKAGRFDLIGRGKNCLVYDDEVKPKTKPASAQKFDKSKRNVSNKQNRKK